MNLDYKKMLFKMFWEQNAEKTFSDFGTLGGTDLKYSDIKLKDLMFSDYGDSINIDTLIELREGHTYLCLFNFVHFEFNGFDNCSVFDINILDHIKFEDKV